jgi:hypothetical protein
LLHHEHRADKYLAKDEKKRVLCGEAKRCLDVISFLETHRRHDPKLLARAIDPLKDGRNIPEQASAPNQRHHNPPNDALNSLTQGSGPNSPTTMQGRPNSRAQWSDPIRSHPNPSLHCLNSRTGASERSELAVAQLVPTMSKFTHEVALAEGKTMPRRFPLADI